MSLMARRAGLMSNKKSGKEIVLLASGTYTLPATASSMTIPVQYAGTVLYTLVEAEDFIPDVTQTVVWQGTFNIPKISGSNGLTSYGVARARLATNTWVSSYSATYTTLNQTSLKVLVASSNYPIRANIYNWYIWGYKE